VTRKWLRKGVPWLAESERVHLKNALDRRSRNRGLCGRLHPPHLFARIPGQRNHFFYLPSVSKDDCEHAQRNRSAEARRYAQLYGLQHAGNVLRRYAERGPRLTAQGKILECQWFCVCAQLSLRKLVDDCHQEELPLASWRVQPYAAVQCALHVLHGFCIRAMTRASSAGTPCLVIRYHKTSFEVCSQSDIRMLISRLELRTCRSVANRMCIEPAEEQRESKPGPLYGLLPVWSEPIRNKGKRAETKVRAVANWARLWSRDSLGPSFCGTTPWIIQNLFPRRSFKLRRNISARRQTVMLWSGACHGPLFTGWRKTERTFHRVVRPWPCVRGLLTR